MAGSGPRGPRWRAMWYCTWLEELVSKSNTIQTQEDISVAGKIAGNIEAKLCIYLWWFFINISGLVNSFGPASCVAQDIISLLQWIAAGSSRKSIWEKLGGNKVSCLIRIFVFSWFGDVWRGQMHPPGPRGPRWRAMRSRTWLEELASESNTIQAQEELWW